MIIPITREMTEEEKEEAYMEKMRTLFAPGLNGGMCLIIDVTGSMGGIISLLTRSLIKYADVMFRGQIERMSLVCMDDHYRSKTEEERLFTEIVSEGGYKSNAVKFAQTTGNGKEFTRWLSHYPSGSGGDIPEAWACSIYAARKLDPEATIWLCTDAPPHGREYSGHLGYHDNFEEGCPCGVKLDMTNVNLLHFSNKKHYIPPSVADKMPDHHTRALASGDDMPSGMLRALAGTNPDSLSEITMAELKWSFDHHLGTGGK